MPFCAHCGASHPDDAGFCPACGLPIGGVITPALHYAGFWIRFLPWVIDSLLIVVPLGVLYSFLGLHHGTGIMRTHRNGGTFVASGAPADATSPRSCRR